MPDTGALSPAANGDDYTGWNNPTNAYSSNDSDSEPAASTNQHDWYNFSIDTTGWASIDGIEVSCEFAASSTGGAARITPELSWDGGTSYTSLGTVLEETGTSDVTHTAGGAAELWGHAWAVGELTNANFRVRLTHGGNRVSYLDHVTVTVTYTASAGTVVPVMMHHYMNN